MANKKVDVAIVGAGWVGGIIASELCKQGLEVVALERGHDRSTAQFQDDHDELRYAIRNELFQNTANETWSFRHNLSETALPMRQLGAWLPGTGIGGAGVHWNGQTWRFHPRDFTIRTSTIDRYGASAIPANMAIQDWGITYEELEPYYDKFEYMAGIAGKAGNLKGQQIEGGNVFEGPRSREFPVKPPPDTPLMSLFRKATSSLGYHPFTGPTANLPATYKNPDGIERGQCTYCGFCERFGCEVGAKADPTVTVLPVAFKTGKFKIINYANAFKINNDGTSAQSILYYDAMGRIQEQPADVIVLGAFMFNNVRLLLQSKLGTPYDPTTKTGVVGRNFCYQTGGGGATGWFHDEEFKRYMGAGALSCAIDDFNADNFDHTGLGFLGGGSITVGQSGARPIQSLSVPPGVPSFGSEWKAAVQRYYKRVVSVGFQGESPAYSMHYCDLDPNYRDKFGNPLLRLTFDWQPNERAMIAFAGSKTLQIMQEMLPNGTVSKGGPLSPTSGDIISGGPGALPAHFDTTSYQSTHITGGTIMGADPDTSVVNNYLQMWDANNVFVVGASNFPQNAGFNPTGTVGALAYRAAEGILKFHKTGGSLV
ncbi:MAG TPA: GMC family oxidoreductase [Gaiellaceae bacterium]|nr:GMC family oxidoreductase [Gaiellaceae bacterium]